MQMIQSRRDFLASASLATAASMFGARTSLAEDGPLETTTVRLLKESGVCDAPLYVAEELLRADGFTDVRYVHIEEGNTDAGMVADGKLDFSQTYAPEALRQIDAGKPIKVLAGGHPGCHELFAREPVNSIRDLKGRSVAVPEEIGYANRLILFVMMSYLGLDPTKEIAWVTGPGATPIDLFIDGKSDAFFGGPLEAPAVRERGFSRVILSTATDPPWSQYLCCVLAGNSDYVQNYPVATKRVVRAVLKAADICAGEPERAARRLVDGGFTERYDYTLQGVSDVPYATWREYNPEDTLRFYALRLREVGMIKSTPQEIIAAGTDWRFLNEIKRELKA
jgi:NitT/TauT family transport system substrate-binding protein